jgi:ATP-dependent DNA helicase RecG
MTVGEIYEKADQSLIQVIQEDRRIERKPAGVHADYLAQYFSMWANSPPEGGLIAVGVENNGSISGCLKVGQSHINELEKAGRNFCPDARYESKHIRVKRSDGADDFLILIRVHYRERGGIVRTNKGDAFVRLGDEKRKLKEDEIRELEIGKGHIDFEQEPTDYESPSDFNTDLIHQYANSYRKIRACERTSQMKSYLNCAI